MRTFQTLANGRVKIVHGRFGGDTSREETRHRRGDNSYRHLRMQQHLRFVTDEALTELDSMMGYGGTLKTEKVKGGGNSRRSDNRRSPEQPVVQQAMTVVVVRRAAPRFKAYIREDGKICAAALN